MTKAYSYLRFSTPDQQQGDSFRRQVKLTKDYADQHSLELDDTLTFHDLGVSAFRSQNAKTGALRLFLEAVESGAIEKGSHLLVESLDRISRDSILEAQSLFLQIVNTGVVLVTLCDQKVYSRDTIITNPVDLIVSLLTMIRANEESLTKSKRIKASWENKRSNARTCVMSAKIPAWLVKDGDRFRVIEDRALIIRRIYTLASQGHGTGTIASLLNRENIPTWGTLGKARKVHDIWHSSYVHKILTNPAVCGDYTPHTITYAGGKVKRIAQGKITDYFPAVIDKTLFNEINQARALKRFGGVRSKDGRLNNLFRGLLACKSCGNSSVHIAKGQGDRQYQYLVCAYAKVGKCPAGYKTLRYDKTETAFLHILPELMDNVPTSNQRETELTKQIRDTETGIDIITESLENLLDAVQEGMPTTPTIVRRTWQLESELAEHRTKLGALRQELDSIADRLLRHRIETVLSLSQSKPLDRLSLNAVLRLLIRRMVITGAMLDIQWIGTETGGTELILFPDLLMD
jgi:DNA invertase Pin-like site-specific DNA recombinase